MNAIIRKIIPLPISIRLIIVVVFSEFKASGHLIILALLKCASTGSSKMKKMPSINQNFEDDFLCFTKLSCLIVQN